jgi:GxxExxY protein
LFQSNALVRGCQPPASFDRHFLLFAPLGSGNPTMHPLFQQADKLSREVIAAAIEVHRCFGPGLLESIYEKCLVRELDLRGISCVSQDRVQIEYKGIVFTEELQFDLLIAGCLLIELKAVEEIHPVHKAQLLSYMKLMNIPLGLLLNFHEVRLVDGISRLVLRGADTSISVAE